MDKNNTIKKIFIGAGIGLVFVTGFILGEKYNHAMITTGLNEVLKDTPELETQMMDAINKTNKRRGKS